MKNLTFSINSIKKTVLGIFGVLGVSLASAALFGVVFASTSPTLSISSLNNGTVQMNISGDSDAQIYLYYYTTSTGYSTGSSAAISLGSIGSTAQNGYLSTSLSPYMNTTNGSYSYTNASYNAALANIPYGAPVFVVIDGLQSSVVAWPLSTNGINGTNGTNALSFSQTSLNLTIGQSTIITAYMPSGYTYSSLYPLTVSSNTNPSIATISTISSNSLTIIGNNYGSTVITVCMGGNTGINACGTIYVTVSSSGIVVSPISTPISLSTSNLNLTAGQSQTIQIYQGSSAYNYSGTYYLSSNTNSAAVSATVNGSSLSVYALTSGSATITVCGNGTSYLNTSYSNGQCATLYVTVSYSGAYNGYGYNGYNNGYNNYNNYPITNNYPIVNIAPVNQYIPATVYSTSPVYSTYSYSSPMYSYSTPTYYSTYSPTYYQY